MSIAEFNQGAALTDDLVDEFGASGNVLVDSLWKRPATSKRQRDRIAGEFMVSLFADSTRRFELLLLRAFGALPLGTQSLMYLLPRRRFRGSSEEWAEVTTLLLMRMPLANVLYSSPKYGDARALLNTCLMGTIFSSTWVEGLDYERHLEPMMPAIIDVVEWFARNRPHAKQDIGLAMNPLTSFLYERREGHLRSGAARESIERLYQYLDANLDIFNDTQGAWPEIHERCHSALGYSRSDSRLFRMQEDVAGLVEAFRQSLSRRIGPGLAERLLSQDYLKFAEFCQREQVTDTLLRLLGARDVWMGHVVGTVNSYDVLHRELNQISNWRDLNGFIRRLAEVDAPASDSQMAKLVHSLADSGNIIADQIIKRALECVRAGSYPRTLAALRALPVTGATSVVPFFDETLAKVRRRLWLMRA